MRLTTQFVGLAAVCIHIYASVAQAQTTHQERVLPKLGIANGSHAAQGTYSTVQAAYDAHVASITAQAQQTPGYSIIFPPSPFPCNGTGGRTYNGYPQSWCWSYSSFLWGQPYSQGVTGQISSSPRCPDADWPAWVWEYLNAGGQYDTHIQLVCSRTIPAEQCPPDSCNAQGNPIYPEDATKRQVEVDYRSPVGPLEFRRIYRNDRGGFSHTFQLPVRGPFAFVDGAPIPPVGGGCYLSSFQGAPYCFPFVTSVGATQEFALPTAQGTLLRFSGPAAGVGPVDAWNKDGLEFRSVSGQQFAFLTRRHANWIDQYDSQWRLVTRQWPNGQRISVLHEPTLMRIRDTFDRTVIVEFDSLRRPTRLTDPANGLIQYSYETIPVMVRSACEGEGCFRPSAVTYADGTVRTYHWDEPAFVTNSGSYPLSRLTGITDELSHRFATYKYDSRWAKSTELAGNVLKYSFSSIVVGSSISITDPLGTTRGYGFTQRGGLVLLNYVQNWCPGCSFQSATYDANGNRESQTDFKGNKTCYAHDLSRNLETRRIEGVANVTCSSALSSPPSGSRVISTQWHPDWRLETRIAEPKKLTTITYNGQGATCAPSTVLVDGKPPAVICTRTEQATTDETGAAGFAATVTGAARTWRYTYTTYGRVLTATDPNNRVTTTSYHPDDDPDLGKRGNVASITNAASHTTYVTDYNPHGQPTRIVDPNGVVTVLTYDPRMRLTSRTVGNEATVFGYDPVGQMTSVDLPDGAALIYTYDAAHRLTAINDHKGNRIDYTLDAMGNRINEQMKDPGGTLVGNIARVIDALNRVQQVTGAVQ